MDPTSLYELRRTGQEPSYATLPKEVKQEIITAALASSETVHQVMNAIKIFSTLHSVQFGKLFGNLKSFTALMDILAKKSPDASRKDIAEKLKIPTAKEYIQLSESFLIDVIEEPKEGEYFVKYAPFSYVSVREPRNPKIELNTAYTLLDRGIDPNFSWIIYPFKYRWIQRQCSLLDEAYMKALSADDANEKNTSENNKLAIFTLLLNRGAKPDAQLMEVATHAVNDFPTNSTCQLLLELLNQANAQ